MVVDPDTPWGATTYPRISTGTARPGSDASARTYSPEIVGYGPGTPGSTGFAGSCAAAKAVVAALPTDGISVCGTSIRRPTGTYL